MQKHSNLISKEARMVRIMSAGDYYKCTACGYTVRYKVLGNTARCSQCGGTMHRT